MLPQSSGGEQTSFSHYGTVRRHYPGSNSVLKQLLRAQLVARHAAVLPYTQWEAGIGRAHPGQALIRYAGMATGDFATKTKSVPLSLRRPLPRSLAAFLPFFSPEHTVRPDSENIRCLQRARYSGHP